MSPIVSDGQDKNISIVSMVLACGVFAGAVSMRSLDALLPEIAAYYGRSIGETGAVVTAFAISYSSCQLIYGPLGDRLGPYRVIAVAAILSGFAALSCAFAPTLDWLVFLRLIAGAVAAGIAPLTLAWLAHATTAKARPVALANITGASIIGGAVGQVGGGLIGQVLNWKASFVIIAAIFFVAGLAMIVVGLKLPQYRTFGRRDSTGRGSSGLGFVNLLRRPAVRWTLAAVGTEGLAMFASFTYVSGLLHLRLDLDMAGIGLLVGLFGIGGIVFVVVVRKVVRRLNEGQRALLGGLMVGAGFLVLTLATSRALAGAALFVVGFGFFMMHNTVQVRATHMAADAPGVGLALFAATFFLAQGVGAAIGGWSFDHLGASVSFIVSAIMLSGLGIAIFRTAKRDQSML